MVEPTVCCVMLTRDRPAVAARAVAAFRAQTYERKKLVVIDTSAVPIDIDGPHVTILSNPTSRSTIGELRNTGNTYACKGLTEVPDIIAHMDDDDISHPNRLAEQVALLQASGADCVGYNEALCWDSRKCQIEVDPSKPGPDGVGFLGTVKSVGEAWLYANHVPPTYALGGSFCYWRKAWEAHSFDAIIQGEDERWRTKVKCVGVSSIPANVRQIDPSMPMVEPRFIIGVHGRNTSPYNMVGHPASFRRVPEWDAYAAERMKL